MHSVRITVQEARLDIVLIRQHTEKVGQSPGHCVLCTMIPPVPGTDSIDMDLTLETGSIHQRYFLAGKGLANRNVDLEFGRKIRANAILRILV